MAYFKGTVQRGQLVDTLVSLLTSTPTGSTEPYWQQVQSGTYANEGVVLYSKGSSGTDKIYVRITTDTDQHNIKMSTIESYTPNQINGLTGTAVNESVRQEISYAHFNNYASSFPVSYELSFDRDRIMLSLIGDKQVMINAGYSAADAFRTLAWVGMPKRISPAGTTDWNDSTGVAFAVSRYAYRLTSISSTGSDSYGQCRVVRARDRSSQPTYHMRTMGKRIGRSKGWGSKIMLPDIYLEEYNGNEGMRSIMHGVHPLFMSSYSTDFKDGDELNIGGKRYTIMNIWSGPSTSYSVNCFPSEWVAVEKLL